MASAALRLPARRRQHPRLGSTWTSTSAPRAARRTCAGSPRWPCCSPTPGSSPWPRSSAPTPKAGAGPAGLHEDAGVTVRRGLSRHPARCAPSVTPRALYARASVGQISVVHGPRPPLRTSRVAGPRGGPPSAAVRGRGSGPRGPGVRRLPPLALVVGEIPRSVRLGVGIPYHSRNDRRADVDFARGVVRSLVITERQVAVYLGRGTAGCKGRGWIITVRRARTDGGTRRSRRPGACRGAFRCLCSNPAC